jgi:hypothetical protein
LRLSSLPLLKLTLSREFCNMSTVVNNRFEEY